MSYHPLKIQIIDQDTEDYSDHLNLHALQVNKTGGGESFNAGAEQYHKKLTFTLRWCKALEEVGDSPQLYRIVYRGRPYNIQDYDDFMEQHITVNLVGEAYG